MTDRPTRSRRVWPVVVGLLLLHLTTVARYEWEGAALIDWLRVSPDLALILAVGIVLVLRFGYRALIGHLAAVAVLLVPLYRFGHTLMPVHYHEFDPYNDILMVPSLVHLLTHDMSEGQRILAFVVTGLAAVALYVAVYLSARAVLRVGTHRPTAVVTLCMTQSCLVVACLETSGRPNRPSRFLAPGMYAEILRDARDAVDSWRLVREFGDRITEAHDRRSTIGSDLARLQGADAYLVFIESYGRALFRSPQTLATYDRWTADLTRRMEDSGFSVCSRFCSPSTVGGGSSIAHAEFLTGVKISSPRMFDDLLQSDLKALPKYFNDAGYLTMQVQPATTEDWPEGRFLGFQEDVFAASLPYQGPAYHWGSMPDQFALNHVLHTRVKASTRPVFMQYVFVTSHAPFSAVPPYYEDWSRVDDPDAFAAPARMYPIKWTNFANHPQLTAAYMDCMHYSLRTVVGFIEQLERPSLLIVLGDHQPPSIGDLMQNDSTHHVPMHAISNRQELLVPFILNGFVEGMRPGDDAPAFPTSGMLYAFLEAFSTPPTDGR